MAESWFQTYLIELVIHALADKQLTQSEVAVRVGISNKHLNQILHAKAWATPEVWTNIFDVLGIIPSLQTSIPIEKLQ